MKYIFRYSSFDNNFLGEVFIAGINEFVFMIVKEFHFIIPIGAHTVIVHTPAIDKHLNISTFDQTLLHADLAFNRNTIASLGKHRTTKQNQV